MNPIWPRLDTAASYSRKGNLTKQEGIVIRAANGIYTVQAGDHLFHCSLRGNLKKELEFSTSGSLPRRLTRARRPLIHDTISIGDRVMFNETQRGAGVIEEILPRHSQLARYGFRGREQTIVCNLDQILIVFACAEPRPDPWKMDRFLAASAYAGIPALIVANKREICSDEEFKEAFSPYESIHYPVIATSAKEGIGVESLREQLLGRVSAFVGPSGVGKSSLLNVVQPGLNLKTGDIGYVTFKGRHTTTSAHLIPLRFGGWVADTPGLRNFDLLDMDRDELVECFPEFNPCLGNCRFDDCRHGAEPGCAIKAAVEAGTVQPRRYESFLALAKELESR